MSSSDPPVIAFELGLGEFRIVTPEAVYEIKVRPDLVEAARAGETQASGRPTGQSGVFYQKISEELFEKVGQLARKLSVSVEELPGQLAEPDFGATDQQLENAKGQLEEIVRLTEKASMTIMDKADQIQVDMDQLKSQLDILKSLDLMTAGEESARPEGPPADARPQIAIRDSPSLSPDFFDKLAELKTFVETLLSLAESEPPAEAPAAAAPDSEPPAGSSAPAAPESEPPAGGSTPAAPTVSFNVDVVFQTLYELCTNEAVKDHIRQMREESSSAFNEPEIAARLSEMSSEVDSEDGFYNFPITAILKTLYSSAASDAFKVTLKKMNQTAASIFLDSVLPIEGQSEEAAAADPGPAAADPGPAAALEITAAASPAPAVGLFSLDDLRAIQNLAAEIETLALAGAADDEGQAALPAAESGGLYTSILTRDRDTIVKTVNMANNLIRQTGTSLTHILETLSFQDLSGQRIMKVVALIGDIQMQLLSILVSANAKMKAHQADGGGAPIEAEKTEKLAREEVDKALEKVSAGASSLMGPGAEARLDQGAVNDLLAQLGF